MNYSKLNDDLVMLFNKPIESPIFKANVPDDILSLLRLLINEDFGKRENYSKYFIDEENHIIALVIKDQDMRVARDIIYYNGKEYLLIIIPNSMYDESDDDFIADVCRITGIATHSLQKISNNRVTARDNFVVDVVDFFKPMIMIMSVAFSKVIANDNTRNVIYDMIREIYNVDFPTERLDRVAGAISAVGVAGLIDRSLIMGEKEFYDEIVTKIKEMQKAKQHEAVPSEPEVVEAEEVTGAEPVDGEVNE